MQEMIVTLASTLWEVWKDMAKMVFGAISKIVPFCLWILMGIIVLPCVFIAGSIYPRWLDWGEDF